MQRSVDQSMKKCINLFEKIEMFLKIFETSYIIRNNLILPNEIIFFSYLPF